MSRVDVVIPCYKYARYLRECVQSVLRQEGVDVRVLVIDDCSPDDTPEVARQLCADDDRVAYRRHPENRGHIATYNEGLIEWAGGDYVLLLSADDMLTPGALRRAAELMDAHPDVVFTYGRAVTTESPAFDSRQTPSDYRQRILSGREFWELSCAGAHNLVPTPTLVVRTSAQQSAGGYLADLPHTGDLEMVMRLAARGAVGVLDCDQAFYRVHGHNMHVSTFHSAMTVVEQHRRAFSMLFARCKDQIPDARRLEEMAVRRTALNTLGRSLRLFEQGDAAGCDRLASVAAEIDPDLPRRPEWRRFRIKRAMGRRLWASVRPIMQRLRNRAPRDRSPFGRSGVFPGM
jgi:glycosyltransferase involved in cell wall biosynthesis